MELAKKKSQINLTEGPLFKRILLFILPLVASNLLQTLYNAADMMVVSLSGEQNAVGAVGFVGSFVSLIVNIFIGFSAGASVVVARAIGAQDKESASSATHTSLLISVIIGTILGAIGIGVSKPILVAMGGHGNLLDLALKYTFIYFLGVPFISLTNFAISIMRAKGNTKTPLIVLSLTGVLNVLLNLFFVLVVGLSVEGVALATVIANLVSGIVIVYILSKTDDYCKVNFKKLRIDKESLIAIVKIGVPSAMQSALFSISNMLIQSSLMRVNNSYGYDGQDFQPVINGNAAAGNLESFAYVAINAVSQAAVTFTSQHVGANKIKRIRKVLLFCYVIATAIALLFATVYVLLNKQLLSLYGIVGGEPGSANALAYQTALYRIYVMICTYFFLGFMEIGSNTVRGFGKSFSAMFVSLLGSCVLRVVWVYTVFNHVFTTLGAKAGLISLYCSYPVSWAITAIAHFVVIILIMKKLLKKNLANDNATSEN